MDDRPRRPRLTRTRRVILLAGGGLLLGLAVVTLFPTFPRPVSLEVVVADPPPSGLRVRSVTTVGDEVVAEAEELAPGGHGPARLRYSLWLRPEPHSIEVRGRGCAAVVRRFTPGDVDRVVVLYRCAGE